MFRVIPLLAIVVAAYFGVAFSSSNAFGSDATAVIWKLTAGDLLVAFGLFMLYVEILKSVRTSMASMIDHGLSLLLFTACLVSIIVLPVAQTGTFFLIVVMCLLDVLAGFTVTLAASRRSVDIGGGGSL